MVESARVKTSRETDERNSRTVDDDGGTRLATGTPATRELPRLSVRPVGHPFVAAGAGEERETKTEGHRARATAGR